MHYNVIIQKKIRKTRRFCAADKYDANGFPGNGGSEKSEVNGMATYYDDTEYERRGGGFWGKFLAVFLGFLFGIICTLGGLAGLGYVLYAKIKIAEGFKAVNKITGSDIDYTEYITEEYAQKTIAELMKDLGALSSDFQNQTASLSSLEKFSPKVRETAESIVKKISEYGVAVDTDVLMTTPLSGMSEFLTDTLNTVEVGKVLDKSGILVESNDSYEILMLLCYGEKGVDYAVDGEGRPVKDDKGNVTMLGSAAPTTVGDLTKDTNKVLDKMTLSAVMNATNSLDNSDPMIRALLYGAEGESYTYDEEKKEVTMLPLRYKYDEENNSITDADGKTYAYDETGKKWLAEDGGYILSLSAQPTVKAAAADEETVSYTYAVYTKEGTLVCSLAAAETPDTYHAFDKQNNLLKHQPLSVGDLMGGDLTGILNDIRLGDALKVTAASDAILIALAYGSEGTDYIIEDGKIKPLTPPTTIGSLTDGQTSEIFDKIELGAVMKVDPSDDVMCALAYGTKNKHYKVVEETVGEETVKTIEMLPIVYTLKDGVLFDDEGNETVSELLAGGVYKVTIAEGEGETATETIYYAKPDAAGAADYFLYETETCAGDKILYKKTTLNDLMNGDASSLIDNVELGTLMGLDGSSDKMLLSLAYGSEGVDYEIDASTNAIVRLEGGKAPTTVKDLRNDETASGLLKGLKLGDVLGISPLDQFDDAKKDPDPMMLALAYGEEGTDYVIEEKDGEKVIVWLGDSGPRTIGDLTAGDSAIFDTITLASVMNLTPASDPIMISLAFGKDTHYTIVEEEFVMLPQKYTLKEGVLYDDNGEAVTAEATGVEGVYKVTFVKGTGETQKTEIYYAKADSAGDAEYYLYTDETCAGEKVLYKKTSIGDLKGDNASDIIKDIQLATVLDLTPSSDSILIALAYGNEGEDFEYVLDGEGNKTGFRMLGDAKPRTIKQLKDSNLVNEIRLSAILQTKPEDKITMYLLYGVEGTHYKMENGEVVMLGDYPPRTIGDLSGDNSPVSTITKDLTIGDLVGTAGDSKLLAKISDWKIAQLSDQSQINTIKLGEVIDIKDTDPALLKNLAETSIGELNTRINTMTLAEILGEEQVNGSTFLKHLDTSTINSLAADLDKLTIQQVFEDKIYKKDADGNYVLGEDGSKVLTGTWKYLLVKDGKEQECQIKEIDSLVSNMTANMQSATLNDLSDDKILTLDEAFRRKNIKYDFGPLEKIEPYFNAQGQEKTTIGELTITELVDYVGKLLDKVGA
ncbi:MAG: hypothetical protein DBY05_02945 [Clostridiales bacterium]|jgi:hypothetical protein|nr:MAG: hypothetical protein DBY05_02945 [Clostridiales bacterium]